MKIAKLILFWVIGLMFIATGLAKFMHLDSMSSIIFTRASYPSWLYYAVAAFELIGGALFLFKKTRQIAALMIGSVMLGAIWTHYYLSDDIGHMVAPVIIILIAVASLVKYKQN